MLNGAADDGKLRLRHGRTMARRYAGHPFVDKGYGAPYLEGARRDRLFAGASSRGFNLPLHLDIASEAGRRSDYCGGGQRILLRLNGGRLPKLGA